jgi:hypothetical protein
MCKNTFAWPRQRQATSVQFPLLSFACTLPLCSCSTTAPISRLHLVSTCASSPHARRESASCTRPAPRVSPSLASCTLSLHPWSQGPQSRLHSSRPQRVLVPYQDCVPVLNFYTPLPSSPKLTKRRLPQAPRSQHPALL